METPLTVSEFIQKLNQQIASLRVQVIGEVSEFSVSAKGHIYFTLKDKKDAHLPCSMWGSDYALNGVKIEIGMEVIVSGRPQFYGPFGKMLYYTNTVSLVGEGALLQAYLKLKEKLSKEGLFRPERKRPIPLFPQNIGIITSLHGAVIHDFNNHLRKSGFKVKMLHSSVEGPESGRELALAVRFLKKEAIDVLVLIRGGGSIQSLAGFDNEALIREIASFPVPVIVGIGHHKDVPLASLVADQSQSTPSLAAALLNKSWEQAEHSLTKSQIKILKGYETVVSKISDRLQSAYSNVSERMNEIVNRYEKLYQAVRTALAKVESLIESSSTSMRHIHKNIFSGFNNHVTLGALLPLKQASEKTFGELNRISAYVEGMNKEIDRDSKDILRQFVALYTSVEASHNYKPLLNRYEREINSVSERVDELHRLIQVNSPERQLSLGYSITYKNGKLLRNTEDVSVNDQLEVQLQNGRIDSKVIRINSK